MLQEYGQCHACAHDAHFLVACASHLLVTSQAFMQARLGLFYTGASHACCKHYRLPSASSGSSANTGFETKLCTLCYCCMHASRTCWPCTYSKQLLNALFNMQLSISH
jgi:hypothetical protein